MNEALIATESIQDRRARQLPAGRHGIPPEQVRAIQQARIIAAVVSVMHVYGYRGAAVGHIIQEAALSRRTFYLELSGRDEAVIIAQDALVDAVRGEGADVFIQLLVGSLVPPELLEVFRRMFEAAMRPGGSRRRLVLTTEANTSHAVPMVGSSRPRTERQLPPGRHGIPRKQVRDHQRERIIEATVRVLLMHGYPTATVEQIIQEALLSRRAFYDLFSCRDEVIIDAQDDLEKAIRGRGSDAFIKFLIGPSAPPELLEVFRKMFRAARRRRRTPR
jgi:AcrR family transcriptional regulator